MKKLSSSRDIIVSRPNRVRVTYTSGRDWNTFYDGKFVTTVSNANKIYAQFAAPPTIDETLDEMAERFDFFMPMSDLFYSSPYDAYIGPETKGGFVGKENVNGTTCDHLSFRDTSADYHLWISEKTSLPCKLVMTYKSDELEQVQSATITFKNWNLAAKIGDQAFEANIPQGFERIPIMERVRLTEESKPASEAQTQPNQK